MLELSRSVEDLKASMKAESDPIRRQQIKRDLDKDISLLNNLRAEIDAWRNGRREGDVEKYNACEKLWNERKMELGL